MENLKKEIKKKRKTISDNTLKIYVNNINRLYKKLTSKKEDFENLSFLKDFEKVNSFLNGDQKNGKKLSLQTKKQYYASIVVALKSTQASPKLLQNYSKEMIKLQETYESNRKEQKKSKTQKENWIEYQTLLNVYKYYKNKVKLQKIRSKKELNDKEMKLLKKFIILSLYLSNPKDNPPRRGIDYAEMIITKKKPSEDNKNYLYIKNFRNKSFIFQNYKTKKTHGRQEIKVSNILNNDLNLWLKFNKTKYLLPNPNGESSITPNQLTKLLNHIFKKRLDKTISINLIRSIIVSEIYKDMPKLKSLEETATKMGHTVQEAIQTYTKKD